MSDATDAPIQPEALSAPIQPEARFAPTQPNATVVLDSVSPGDVRLTTIEVTLHRFVLAELNTHRMFSRNSASSRAIPTSTQLDRVRNDPAIPVEFGANQRGMQAGDPLRGPDHDAALKHWLAARDGAVDAVLALAELGVHKQVVNRLLEPFMWQTVIVTATEWDGFWHQRCSPLAQPEIRLAAEAMKSAYDSSTPEQVATGGWHTPYVRPDERDLPQETRKRISAARCARVSYLTHDGRRDLDADDVLYQRLVTADPPHWSPLEHVATPTQATPTQATPTQATSAQATPIEATGSQVGNFRGWRQLRHVIDVPRATN